MMIGFRKCKGKGGKKKKLIDLLNFPVLFFDTEDGSGGAPAEGAGESSVDVLDGIPETALEGDPELREILEEEKNASKKDVKNKGSEDDPAREKDPDAENSGADDDKTIPADDDNADDKNSSEDSIDDIEFADNVIEGLKGEDLKKLPKEALEALAVFVEKHTNVSGEATKASESLNKLLADPIVKRRQELLKNGKTDYEVRGLNETEKQSILKQIKEKAGLDEEEAETVFNILKDGIDTAVKDSAKDALQNMILEDAGRQKHNETITKGRTAFLNMGKFNKDLQFKETDPNKFWKSDGTFDDSHPEAKKFREKMLPAMEGLSKSGLNYENISKMRENAVYALVAEQLGLPVAFNTGERDKKIIASELRKKLGPLMKANGSKELSVNGGSSIAEARNKSVIKSGYDIEKLAEGGSYYEKALIAKPGDPKHMQLIEELAEEGEALLAKKQKPKK